MKISTFVIAAVAFGLAIAPAQAWMFEDDGTSWPMFGFHQYGGDVNRPAATPDRPYFHGDDAVPLGLRWHDLEQARAEAAAEDAAVAASMIVVPPPAMRRHAVVRHGARRHIARRKAVICVPAKVAIVP